MSKRLDEIEKRAEKATKGPWTPTQTGIVQTAHTTRDVWHIPYAAEDISFIAHAREDIPWLVAEVKRLQAELNK